MVMQQVMPQKNNNMNEASDIYYVLGFFGGIFLPIIIFALILIFTHGEVRRKLRNGALAGILITFVLTILIVQFMH
jgi:glucan phosphoethanolaminetransferase (alkaline phosphatase superfamily)